MGEELRAYLEKAIKVELKWMHHYNVDDEMFGVETDKYTWCKNVVSGSASIESLLRYFEKYYSKDETKFISGIRELI